MIALFFREDDGKKFFYPVVGQPNEDWALHAELNPGTLRIEDIEGNVLWPTPPRSIEGEGL